MSRRRLALLLLVPSSLTVGACDFFYIVQARVPLATPVSQDCLQSMLANGSQHQLDRSKDVQLAGNRTVEQHYTTEGLFNNRWENVSQTVHRDSAVFHGMTYRDSSAMLVAQYVSVNRRFDANQGASMGNELAGFLLNVRDKCGGRSPGDERLYAVAVSETPFQSWIVHGTRGRVAMRLTVRDREYWTQITRHAGTFALHVDTLADSTDLRGPRWLEVDRVELPAAPKGTSTYTECWHASSPSTGTIVARARDSYDDEYLTAAQAWSLDLASLRIHPAGLDSVECLNTRLSSQLPDAPRALRLAAITFRPSPGISRIYAYLPGFALKDAIAGVAVDGQLVGQLNGGSYLMVELPPGHHRITAITSHYANSVALDVSPDSSAFVQLHWKKMSWTRQADFVTPDPARIRDAIRAAHMVTSSWPGTPMP